MGDCRLAGGVVALLLAASSAAAQEQPEQFAQDRPAKLAVKRPFHPAPAYPNIPPGLLPAPSGPSLGTPDSRCPVDPRPPVDPKQTVDPKQPADPETPAADRFAAPTEAGTQAAASFSPNMFGDLFGISGRRIVTIPGQFVFSPINATQNATAVTTSTNNSTATTTSTVTTIINRVPVTTVTTNVTNTTDTTTNTTNTTTNTQAFIREPARASVQGIPIAGQYNGFKVSDNESPRPVDRVFATYNYYDSINRSLIPAAIPTIDGARQLFGFEKTFLGGDASVGLRLPYIQLYGASEFEQQFLGDLNLVLKYAFINDRETGNVVSGGLVITAPTGGGQIFLADGTTAPHVALVQPWGGFIYNMPRMFIQGFTSVVVPTSQRDPSIFFNSFAAGWWLYRADDDRLLSAIVPVLECHLNTPLNHRSQTDTIFFQDQFNITAGAYAVVGRMTIGAAVGTPVLGPRPFQVEAIASVNLRF